MSETYLYRLRLRPELHAREMNADERAAQKRHLDYLSSARDHGIVVLAGRTDEPLDRTVGIVLLNAASEAEARAFMAHDPAVSSQLMNADLVPFRLAVSPKPPR